MDRFLILTAGPFGPWVFRFESLQAVAECMAAWMRSGCAPDALRLHRLVRGRWVPLTTWAEV